MENNNLGEVFHGSEFISKENEAKQMLAAIEVKYASWFNARQDIFDSSSPDRLHNHWYSNSAKGNISFGFWPDSELPTNIKDECENIWKIVYQE